MLTRALGTHSERPTTQASVPHLSQTMNGAAKIGRSGTKRKTIFSNPSKASTGVFRARQISGHLRTRGKHSRTESDDEQLPDAQPMQHFRISDGDKVKQYLLEHFQLLQQQSCKKIAKAWIKAICPKKQARFPYRRRRRNADEDGQEPTEVGEAPGWWPIETCPHTEPDHVCRRCELIQSAV